MTNYKTYIVLVFIIGIYSCDSKVKSVEKNSIKEDQKISVESSQFESKKEMEFKDTIHINYYDHKTLLNILK